MAIEKYFLKYHTKLLENIVGIIIIQLNIYFKNNYNNLICTGSM